MGATKRMCVKCDGEMEAGVIVAQGNVPLTEKWIKGRRETSWTGGTKTTGKRARLFTTWRCSGCGCLESYAK